MALTNFPKMIYCWKGEWVCPISLPITSDNSWLLQCQNHESWCCTCLVMGPRHGSAWSSPYLWQQGVRLTCSFTNGPALEKPRTISFYLGLPPCCEKAVLDSQRLYAGPSCKCLKYWEVCSWQKSRGLNPVPAVEEIFFAKTCANGKYL